MVDEILEMNSNDPIKNASVFVGHPYDTLYTKFCELMKLFQKEGLDYQLNGEFSVSLKYRNEFFPMSSIIQINLNEKDIKRFESICNNLNITVKDNRMHSLKKLGEKGITGPSEIVALYNDIPLMEIHSFERLVDGTFILKDYYQDDEHHTKAQETIFGSKLAKEIFKKDNLNLMDYTIPIVSIEYLFLEKTASLKLINFLEKKIDNRRVSNIRNLLRCDKAVQFVLINELPNANIINHDSIENDNTDISHMILDAHANDISETQNLEFLKTKQLHKIDDDEKKQSTLYLIITSILTILVLLLISFILCKMFIK